MEPRIVYCKPKSKQFIGSYQSEVICALPETGYSVDIDKFFGACEMYSGNLNNNSVVEPILASSADSMPNYDDDKSVKQCEQEQVKGNGFIIMFYGFFLVKNEKFCFVKLSKGVLNDTESSLSRLKRLKASAILR